MLFAQNTVIISSSEWHQCRRQNCCQHKPYFTLKCTKSNVGWGSAQDPAAGTYRTIFTALHRAPSWI